jgi:hypothetical protein
MNAAYDQHKGARRLLIADGKLTLEGAAHSSPP